MKRSKFLILVLVLFLLSTSSWGMSQSMGSPGRAADFTLQTIDEEEITLSEALKEKKAVLLFWTTWCPFCRRELKLLEKFYIRNKDEVAVIAIDISESKRQVLRFLQKIKLSFPIALDLDGRVAKLYKLFATPGVVAVDKDSKILYYGTSLAEMKTKVKF